MVESREVWRRLRKSGPPVNSAATALVDDGRTPDPPRPEGTKNGRLIRALHTTFAKRDTRKWTGDRRVRAVRWATRCGVWRKLTHRHHSLAEATGALSTMAHLLWRRTALRPVSLPTMAVRGTAIQPPQRAAMATGTLAPPCSTFLAACVLSCCVSPHDTSMQVRQRV